MPYDTKGIKLYYTFDDATFRNEVDTATMTVTGSPSIVPAEISDGWQMDTNTYASTSTSLGITNAFSIGFWLKSVNPGLGNDAGTLVPMKMSLFAKAQVNDGGASTTITNAQFYVWEETQPDGTNVMKIFLKNASGSDCTVTTPTYTVGVFHYFVLVYSAGSFTCYIDGVSVGVTTSAAVPSSLASTTQNFVLNKGPDGNSYELIHNTGVLDDLFLCNTALSSNDASKVYTTGVQYVFNSSYTSILEVDNSIVFSDPSTVQVNVVGSDNSDIYVGRSDGKLLKGYRQLWQYKQGFGSKSEQQLIEDEFGPVGNGSKYSITNGVLTVKSILVNL